MPPYPPLHHNRSAEGRFKDDSGYTLLELVIVISILGAMVAISWPRVHSMLRQASHQQAALQLKEHCVIAREQAIRNGETWELYCFPGSSQYAIRPVALIPTEALSADTLPETKARSRDKVAPEQVSPMADLPKITATQQLPEMLVFPQEPVPFPQTPQNQPLPAPTASQSIELPGSDKNIDQTSEPRILARFFPDGRVTNASIKIVTPETGDSIHLMLRGLTGGITIGPLVKAIVPDATLPQSFPSPRSQEGND